MGVLILSYTETNMDIVQPSINILARKCKLSQTVCGVESKVTQVLNMILKSPTRTLLVCPSGQLGNRSIAYTSLAPWTYLVHVNYF
jgi:hypothetical protein